MLNRASPRDYSKGSVGASGDLAQWHNRLLLMGEGEAFYKR
jgi:histidine ammonia-lyase